MPCARVLPTLALLAVLVPPADQGPLERRARAAYEAGRTARTEDRPEEAALHFIEARQLCRLAPMDPELGHLLTLCDPALAEVDGDASALDEAFEKSTDELAALAQAYAERGWKASAAELHALCARMRPDLLAKADRPAPEAVLGTGDRDAASAARPTRPHPRNLFPDMRDWEDVHDWSLDDRTLHAPALDKGVISDLDFAGLWKPPYLVAFEYHLEDPMFWGGLTWTGPDRQRVLMLTLQHKGGETIVTLQEAVDGQVVDRETVQLLFTKGQEWRPITIEVRAGELAVEGGNHVQHVFRVPGWKTPPTVKLRSGSWKKGAKPIAYRELTIEEIR
ncbi:MAG: hypothetical protein R3F30_16220 [Planctomycetota bacterium]